MSLCNKKAEAYVLRYLIIYSIKNYIFIIYSISYSYIICFNQTEKMLINQLVNKFITRIK